MARAVLRYAIWLASFAALAALGSSRFGFGWPLWVPALVVVLALPLGIAAASRRMPSTADLVLYVDARASAGHAIVSAWELSSQPARPFDERTRSIAVDVLAAVRSRDLRPRLFGREIWTLPVSMTIFVLAFVLPPPPPSSLPPAVDTIVVQDVEALRRIEELPDFVPDEEARRRLQAIADDTAELRQDLEQGLDRREALDRLQQLHEALREATQTRSAREKRALDAAAEALSEEHELAEALGRRDFEALDRAAERAAGRRERADRERAKRALDAAVEAAMAEGDEALAGSLLQRRDLLQRREEQAALARELAEAMPELVVRGLGRELERLERDGDGQALDRAMVDALKEGWGRLSAEERERLAEALRKAQAAEAESKIAQSSPAASEKAPTADEIEAMLRAALENVEALRNAATGAGAGTQSMPIPRLAQRRTGAGGRQGSAGSNGSEESADGAGSPGGEGSGTQQANGSQQGGGAQAGRPGGGAGEGARGGQTEAVDGDALLARVRPRSNPGLPSRSWVVSTNPELDPMAPIDAVSPTGAAAGGEAGGVEQETIPQDYREHVKAYFQR